jgi:hypothetical protein
MSNGQKSSQVSGCVNGLLADPRAYFFSLIQRTEGSPAPDWKAILESLPGRGMGANPRPNEIQPQNAPHYGITVMIDAGGNARGRIWLPTDQAQTDHNGNRWFTHEIQVIADGPTPGSFVWAWEDKGGPPYSPRPCPQSTGSGTGAPTPIGPATTGAGGGVTASSNMVIDLRPLEARIQALEALVAAQADAIADLKKRPVASPAPSGGTFPKKVALKTDHGTYVTAEPDGRMTNREDHPASWQTFKVEGMD